MITSISRTGVGATFDSNVATFPSFNTVVFNDLGIESYDAANLGLFTYTFPTDGIRIQYSGLYYVTTGISFPTQSLSGRRLIFGASRAEITGFVTTDAIGSVSVIPSNNNNAVHLNYSGIIRCFEEDIIKQRVLISGTGSITAGTSADTNCFDSFLTVALIIK